MAAKNQVTVNGEYSEPLVSIGQLTVAPRRTHYQDTWVCVFPEEIGGIGLSKPQLTLFGAILSAVGQVNRQGNVLFKTGDITTFAYPYRLQILGQLAQLEVVRKETPGVWSINPRYVWAGPLEARKRAIWSYETQYVRTVNPREEEKKR
jgi:hypothetical protein